MPPITVQRADMTKPMTRAEVAAHFQVSERTLRRVLVNVPGLTCIKVGRRVLFGPAELARIERELQCPYTIGCAAKSGTFMEQSASVARRSRYLHTPQDAALAEMRNLRE